MKANNKLQQLYLEKKLTKQKVQEIIGRSKPYTLQLFSGKRSLSLDEADKIETYFNLSKGFFSGKGQETTPDKEKIKYLEEMVQMQREIIEGFRKLNGKLEQEVKQLKKVHSR